MQRTKLIIILSLALSIGACSTIQVTPAVGTIEQGRIKHVDFGYTNVVVSCKPTNVMYKNSPLFADAFIVDANTVCENYIRLLRKQITGNNGRIVAPNNSTTAKRLGITIYKLDYLGPVSLSFNATAWLNLMIRLGNGKLIDIRVHYTTPRSLSLRQSFLQQSFGGAVSNAVVKTMNNQEFRRYLLSE